jgi:flagellar motor switch/type III secretory pathway protein FliN
MATAQATPAPANSQHQVPAQNSAAEAGNNQALVPAPQLELDQGDHASFGAPIVLLPVELDVAVPVRNFRVRNLLALAPGQLIESQWGNGEDVPLASGDVQLAWSEFEVIDTQLAVRITRLA